MLYKQLFKMCDDERSVQGFGPRARDSLDDMIHIYEAYEDVGPNARGLYMLTVSW